MVSKKTEGGGKPRKRRLDAQGAVRGGGTGVSAAPYRKRGGRANDTVHTPGDSTKSTDRNKAKAAKKPKPSRTKPAAQRKPAARPKKKK